MINSITSFKRTPNIPFSQSRKNFKSLSGQKLSFVDIHSSVLFFEIHVIFQILVKLFSKKLFLIKNTFAAIISNSSSENITSQ